MQVEMATEMHSGSRWARFALLLPLVLTAIAYIPSSGNRGVLDYDEGHYSQVAVQMVRSGDWVTPYDNGVRFLEKPPLMYWVSAASMEVFGVTEFGLRLPTALGVIALVWIVTLMARRASGDNAAIIAGLCTSLSVGTCLFTRETLHDIWLVLFIALALYAFLDWYLDPRHSWWRAMLFYVALAGAVMTKSLIGVAFPAGIVVVFYLLRREWPEWRKWYLASGTLLFLALSVPWHWLAAVRNQGFLYSFFLNEQFFRFLGKHDPPIVWSLPLITFWALILLWFFPWTPFLPAAFAASRKPASAHERTLLNLVMAWLIVILGFYSVSGRLEHYAFPLLPAFSLLVGVGLSRTGESKAVKWGFRALAILGGVVVIGVAAVAIWFSASGHGFGNGTSVREGIIYQTDFSIMADMPVAIQRNLVAPAVLTVLTMAVGFLAALWFETRRRRMRAVISLAAVMFVVCGMVQWSLIICEDMVSSKKFGLAIAREARPGDHVVVGGDFEASNSICFYEPLNVEVLDGVSFSLIPGMRFPDAPRVVLTTKQFDELWRSKTRVFALLPKAKLDEMKLGGTEMLQVLDRVLVRNH